jgi:3-phosphoshikimate 1-carboxyvinyltransferase
MSAAIAALACDEPVVVVDAQAVNKSYPAFWTDYQRLGGRVVLEDDL